MKLLNNLYVGEKLKASGEEKIIKDLKKNKIKAGYYVIALSSNPDNQLDIYSSFFLTREWQRKMVPLIAGIANDRQEAFIIVDDIMKETFKETGGYDMRAYLLGKAGKS